MTHGNRVIAQAVTAFLGSVALQIALGTAAGAAAGVGVYTFVYAKGFSYMGNDAATCANCHVMNDHYNGWIKGTHHAAAVCNDCHTPHHLPGKYATKALNGAHHSFAFTSGLFPDHIRITEHDRAVTEGTCRACHGEIVMAIDTNLQSVRQGKLPCVRCHDSVGHME
jgi:cytochrome c nitrite reductase small subunit